MGNGPLGRRLRAQMLRQATGLDRLELDPGFLGRLAASDTARAACKLTLCNDERLHRAVCYLAAGIYASRLRGAVLRRQRLAFEAMLGAEAFAAGLRQPPGVTGTLAALASNAAQLVLPSEETPPEGMTTAVVAQEQPIWRHAAAVTRVLVGAEAPVLGQIIALRLPLTDAAPVTPPTEAQARAAWQVLAQAG